MLKYKKIWSFIFALCLSVVLQAQDTVAASATNDGWMRSEAKIYVVGTVVLTILSGLIIYVIRIDSKLSRLERGRK